MSDDTNINQEQIDWYIRASGGPVDRCIEPTTPLDVKKAGNDSIALRSCKECGKGHPEKSMWWFETSGPEWEYDEEGYVCHGCAKYRITEAYDSFEYPEELQWENYKPWKDLSNAEELERIAEVCTLFINQEKEK